MANWQVVGCSLCQSRVLTNRWRTFSEAREAWWQWNQRVALDWTRWPWGEDATTAAARTSLLMKWRLSWNGDVNHSEALDRIFSMVRHIIIFCFNFLLQWAQETLGRKPDATAWGGLRYHLQARRRVSIYACGSLQTTIWEPNPCSLFSTLQRVSSRIQSGKSTTGFHSLIQIIRILEIVAIL